MPRGALPKVYPSDLVERVSELYEAGSTQAEVAQQTGTTQKVIWNLMRRHGLAKRPQIKRDQQGPNNSSWKGDRAGYQALHLRVDRMRGKPAHCEKCDSRDDPTKTYEWANLTGNYTEIDDYERMCRSCHRRYDFARKEVVSVV